MIELENILRKRIIQKNLDNNKIIEKRKKWYFEVEKEIKTNTKYSDIQICTILRNRLLWFEHQQLPGQREEFNEEEYTLTFGDLNLTNKDACRISKIYLVKENTIRFLLTMQDLPTNVLFLSFLAPNRKPNQLVISEMKCRQSMEGNLN